MVSTAPTASAPVVDTHAHIFVEGLPLVDGATNRPPYSCTDEDYLRTLDDAGVRFGVIAAPSFLGTHNDYTLECLRRQPRLRGTAIVAPDVSTSTLQAMDRDGMVGVRYSLRRYPNVPDLTAPAYQRLLRTLIDLDWHVHILAESERLAYMVPVLAASGVKLVIDHFGVPQAGDCPGLRAILHALQNGRTWVKLSAPYRVQGRTPASLAARYLAEGGSERLLWGSDWPWVAHEGQFSYADTIRWLHDCVPDPQIRAQIDRNAIALYRFLEK